MSKEVPLKIGHDDLMYSLEDYLRKKSDRLVWTDMQLGPAGSPRPDCWSVNKSYARTQPLAYECKVSVSDFRSDITSGKWHSYLNYSCGVIFATPVGLISKDDLPKGCGWMTFNGTEWRTVKGPTIQVCPSFLSPLTMKLLIDGVDRQVALHRQRSKSEWEIERTIRQKWGDKVGQVVRDELSLNDRIQRLRDEYARADQEERERMRRNREQNTAYAEGKWEELCKILKLHPSSNTWDIDSRIKDLVRAVSVDDEVSALVTKIKRVQSALEAETPNQIFLPLQ